jgi:predicted naringenin-chalcone synthase
MKEMSLKMFEYFGIQTDEITHYALHPGGKKILENLEKALHITPEQNQNAYEILKNYGNMSSVTIWFVWEKYWNTSSFSHQNSKMLSMAFGPGLTLEASLMNI